MRYDAEIRVFDMLDQVHVSVRVFCTGVVHLDAPEVVLEETKTFPGTGEDDPEYWLTDAVMELLEHLKNRENPAARTGLSW